MVDSSHERIDSQGQAARILILSIGTKEEVLFYWGHFFINLIQKGYLVSYSGPNRPSVGKFQVFFNSLGQGIRGLVLARFQDIVVARGVVTGLVLSSFLRIAGRKVRLVVVDAGVLRMVSRFSKVLLIATTRIISNKSTALLCYSRYESRLWEEVGIRNVHFFYLSQSLPQLTPRRSERPYVFSGGLTGRDFRTLITAAKDSDTDFVVVGGTDPVTGLDNLRQLDFPPNVAVERNVNRERFEELIARSMIVVLPLLPVPYPVGQTVLVTAMSYGKPIVATINSGTVDYIRNGKTGVLVPTEDGAALREAISRLMKDETSREILANNALAVAKREFDPSLLAAEFIQICDELEL